MKEAVPSYRPRSTVSVMRAESMNSPMSVPMNMPQSTALPVISEAVPCEGMREISGGVYEDGTGRTVLFCTYLHT